MVAAAAAEAAAATAGSPHRLRTRHKTPEPIARGSSPATDNVAAAREILSGPPKAQTAELTEFLWGGSFAISVGE